MLLKGATAPIFFLAGVLVLVSLTSPEPVLAEARASTSGPHQVQSSGGSPDPLIASTISTYGGYGGGFSCAIRESGQAVCWGANGEYGQLGNGSFSNSNVPVEVQGLDDAKEISVGESHACAIRQSGQAVCWGNGSKGQLGSMANVNYDDYLSPTPVEVRTEDDLPLSDAKAIAVGGAHSCAIRQSGQAVCWGWGILGQIGDGKRTSWRGWALVRNLPDAKAITAGRTHTCAVRESGQALCWGLNAYGEIGDGTSMGTNEIRDVPQQVQGLPPVKRISAGSSHTCAVKQSGQASCWGSNTEGQLGNDYSIGVWPGGSNLPGDVGGLTDAKEITAGGFHSCAIRQTGQAVCWGGNTFGALGSGPDAGRPDAAFMPVEVRGLSDAASVSAGLSSTCGLRLSGEALCWGENASGQLGNGTSGQSNVPVNRTGLKDGISVSAGNSHTCAVRRSGQALCWGDNNLGKLGNGAEDSFKSDKPVQVSGPRDFRMVSVGNDHSCGVRKSGQAACWGSNFSGQVGDGSNTNRHTPVNIRGLGKVKSISAGGFHTCAVRPTGQAICWGHGVSGQLGNGIKADALSPVAVQGAGKYRSIASSTYGTCAIRQSGQVACWGQITDSDRPVNIRGLNDAREISAGLFHACAVRQSGEGVCWGSINEQGQLGDGSFTPSKVPVPVRGAGRLGLISAGEVFTCAARRSGQVICWGQGRIGQLGSGMNSNSNVPVVTRGLADVRLIDTGTYHACAVKRSGEILCWGSADRGQLGTGFSPFSYLPERVRNGPG